MCPSRVATFPSWSLSYKPHARTKSNDSNASKETGYGTDDDASIEGSVHELYYIPGLIRCDIKRLQRMNTYNFDVFSHRFVNEYHSSCGSYDNDLKSSSSETSLFSSSSDSQKVYQIKPQGKVENTGPVKFYYTE